MLAIYRKISPNKIFVNFNAMQCIDFPINDKTGKFKGFAFIKAPAHITDELIKLDGFAYHDNELRVEDAT